MSRATFRKGLDLVLLLSGERLLPQPSHFSARQGKLGGAIITEHRPSRRQSYPGAPHAIVLDVGVITTPKYGQLKGRRTLAFAI